MIRAGALLDAARMKKAEDCLRFLYMHYSTFAANSSLLSISMV